MTSLHCLLAISRADIESVASVTASLEDDDVAQDMPEEILAMIRSQTSWTATHGSASVMFVEVKGGVDVFLDAPWTANDAYAGRWWRASSARFSTSTTTHEACSSFPRRSTSLARTKQPLQSGPGLAALSPASS